MLYALLAAYRRQSKFFHDLISLSFCEKRRFHISLKLWVLIIIYNLLKINIMKNFIAKGRYSAFYEKLSLACVWTFFFFGYIHDFRCEFHLHFYWAANVFLFYINFFHLIQKLWYNVLRFRQSVFLFFYPLSHALFICSIFEIFFFCLFQTLFIWVFYNMNCRAISFSFVLFKCGSL